MILYSAYYQCVIAESLLSNTLFNPKIGCFYTLFNPKMECFYTLFNPECMLKKAVGDDADDQGVAENLRLEVVHAECPQVESVADCHAGATEVHAE